MRDVTLFSRVLGALVLTLLASGTASSATAPATPTYALKWGNFGVTPAQFIGPAGIATDPMGNVFVLDPSNSRVQKFDHFGRFIRMWGSNGLGNGNFFNPTGIATDNSGNVFVADGGNSRIQKFTNDGAYQLQWGAAGTGSGQFNLMSGSPATDAAGNVYVADQHRIQKFTGAGVFMTQWGSLGSGDGQFNQPKSVATDPAGYVYVVDRLNSRIQKFTSAGTFVTKWILPGNLSDVAADALGDVYVVDDIARVQRFSGTGTFETGWGSLGAADGQFDGPKSLDVDPAGNVYVADTNNNRIQKFSGAGVAASVAPPSFLLAWGAGSSISDVTVDAAGNVYSTASNLIVKYSRTGTYLTSWGATGSGNGQFNGIAGIAVDPSGDVFVLDYGNRRVQRFTATGTYLTQWGSPGSGDGQFNNPEDMAVDAAGNVYVADAGNSRIEKFTGTGTYLTQWGFLGSGNGQLNQPLGVATDAAGGVYVADTGNHRIEKFTDAGAYLTQWGSLGGGSGQFNTPYQVATSAAGDVYVLDAYSRIQQFTGTGTYLTQWGSFGSGNGQFNNAHGIALDATGNFYVGDPFNNRIQRFVTPPAIALISDVGNDQGRQVRLRILPGSTDVAGSDVIITGYAVYRRIDPLSSVTGFASMEAMDLPRVPDLTARSAAPAGAALAGWDYVTTIPARGDAEYNVVVPTLADANASTSFYTAFFVSALTTDPLKYYDSSAEYGYSIDNLPPPAPTPFTAAYAAGATHLHWGASSATDFATFRLYRGADAGFVPGSVNLLSTTADTGYADAGPAGGFYKLSAVDRNGNESPLALVSPNGTADAPGAGLPRSVELAGAFPNPIGMGGTFRYALPRAMTVSLALYDIAGRKVRVLAEGARPAGEASVSWDGRDDAGRTLPSGLLVLRLAAEGWTLTQRVVTLE